jgi:hypothetical protein
MTQTDPKAVFTYKLKRTFDVAAVAAHCFMAGALCNNHLPPSAKRSRPCVPHPVLTGTAFVVRGIDAHLPDDRPIAPAVTRHKPMRRS